MSGDLPAIMMIVISIAFFLSSITITISQFEGAKYNLNMHSELVDASSVFLKENAKINPGDLLDKGSIWKKKLDVLRDTYGISVYLELTYLDDTIPGDCAPSYPCDCSEGNPCTAGDPIPDGTQNILSKRFPVAMQREGGTELEVYPALVKVSVYTT